MIWLSKSFFGRTHMNQLVVAGLIFLSSAGPAHSSSGRQRDSSIRLADGQAHYKVRLVSLSPLRLNVSANLPIDGMTLDMDKTYAAELAEMAAKGWPALVSNLTVRDTLSKTIELTAVGKQGWNLSKTIQGRLEISYDVDYSLFAVNGWSSPLESAFADDDCALLVGRSLFITSPQSQHRHCRV